MEPNTSYISDTKTPQEIRNDFLFLTDTFDSKYVINAIATQLNTDQLADLIDDFNMGRIWLCAISSIKSPTEKQRLSIRFLMNNMHKNFVIHVTVN